DGAASAGGSPWTWGLDIARPWRAAARPPRPPTAALPLLAPRPRVEADVPPAAALPAVPPTVLPPMETFDPAVEADARVCAAATELARRQRPAITVKVKRCMVCLLSTVDSATARG